jgi:hypothetical protein
VVADHASGLGGRTPLCLPGAGLCQRAQEETEWNQAQIEAWAWEDPLKSALPHGQHALSLARGIHDKELEARCLSLLGVIHLRGGDFQEAIHCVEASLALYAALGSEPTASRELSLPSLTIDSPLTQPLTNRASEALCWAFLSLAQVHVGQVQSSIRSGRRALALSQRARTPRHKSAVRSASRMACWTRGIMKRRSGSRSTPSR